MVVIKRTSFAVYNVDNAVRANRNAHKAVNAKLFIKLDVYKRQIPAPLGSSGIFNICSGGGNAEFLFNY